MGSQHLRSFIADIRSRHKGLYVSTGGFTKEARYEADRVNNQVSLIDSDELVNLIIHYYDNFDAEANPSFHSGKFTGLNRIQENCLPDYLHTECHLVFV